MRGQSLLTNVRHDVGNRTKTSTFYVVSGSPYEFEYDLGELYVSPSSVRDYFIWRDELQPDSEFLFLISTDMKYGEVRRGKDLYPDLRDGESLIEYWDRPIDAGGIEKLETCMMSQMETNPKLAAAVGDRLPKRPTLIPDRFTLENAPERFSVEQLPGEIGGPGINLESAPDDSIVWLALIGANECEGFTEQFNEAVRNELKLRIAKKINFRANFFPLDSVTEKEVDARARRAKRAIEKFEAKFPYGEQADLHEVERYARRLNTDQLAELTVVRFFKEHGFDEKAKWLGAELQQRLGRGWD